MAVYSMTGYGSATQSGGADTPAADSPTNHASVTVDIRAVNGRFLDVTIKSPEDARNLEAPLRELVASRIKRGKVELRVSPQRDTDSSWPVPAPEQLMQLARIEGMVLGFMAKAQPLSVHEVMQWCRQSAAPSNIDATTLAAAKQAIDAMVEARRREGARLADALKANTARVRGWAQQAQPLVASVVQRQQQRFLERWREALATAGASQEVPREAAQERALTEAATYALRIDVAEELTRLNSHLDEMDALLAKGGELGKRLDFLVQEMHREANTLGAKSQAIELTNLSMEMKVAIEQMREQVQNIE